MTQGTLVLGIGNVLMGDEGVGVCAIRRLADREWREDVTLVDGGTGGFHLLEYFRDRDRVIIIDAAMDGLPAGTVSALHPRYASDFPRALTAHDIGLRDLIEAAELLAPLPPLTLVTVSIERITPMSTTLSRDVEAAVPLVVAAVRTMLTEGAVAHA